MHLIRPLRRLVLISIAGLFLIAGCGSKMDMKAAAPGSAAADGEAPSPDIVASAGGEGYAYYAESSTTRAAGDATPAKPAMPRKLVFNADVQIIVTNDSDLDSARAQLRELIKTHGGIVTEENTSGTTGLQRTGRWTIRVPVDRFDTFLDELATLGIVDRLVKKSQDVTEEFYDLGARIKHKESEEAGLIKLQEKAADNMLKDPKASMDDVLAVRRELNNVRLEIERMKGRLKLLTNLTDLTTVTLTIQERKNYVPPTAPTFGGRIGQTFSDSVDALKRFGQGMVIVAVGLGPWLPVIAVVVVPLWLLIRRAIRRARTTPAIVEAVAIEK
jgi:hypothetical protein